MLKLETHRGKAISAGGLRLIPIARSVRVSHPWGGLLWSGPAAVAIASAAGETRVPIRDPTRRAQLALLAAGILGSLVLWRRRKRTSKEKTDGNT